MSTKKVYIFFCFFPSIKAIPLKHGHEQYTATGRDSFLREWTIPEEDSSKYTHSPGLG